MNNKQYLISFLATIQGEKMVITQMRQLEKSQGRLKTTTQATTTATKAQSASYGKLALRAIAVIPIWMALRVVYMGLIRTIGDMVKAHFDLEEGLARIGTVVHGTTAAVETEMFMIKRQILDMATKTKVPIKDLAETFYFLRTSALSTEEAIAAFTPTINAMVGTGVKAKEMARAIAGSFNTMGKFMDSSLTSAEKLTKIADILTYTYATQDVEMSELVAGYSKLAPYVSGLEDSFLDMVTTLGFLNTQMLRGSRTGRLLGRSVLQLVKNSSQLARIFGITFEPDEPIRFLSVIQKISESMRVTGKLTERQTAALNKIFATRGGVPVRLMVASFEELTEAIEKAEKSADGFAKKIAELRMDTARAQMARMKNVLHALFEEFITAAIGAGDFVEALQEINAGFATAKEFIRGYGYELGWLGYNIAQLILMYEQLGEATKGMKFWEAFISPVQLLRNLKRIREAFKSISEMKLGYVGREEYFEKIISHEIELLNKRKEGASLLEKTAQIEKQTQDLRIFGDKSEIESLNHKIKLMKIIGDTQLTISLFKLREVKLTELSMQPEEYKLKLLKAQNEVVQSLVKGRQDELKKMMALRQQYALAGQEEREKIERLMELLRMKPQVIAGRYQIDMFDRKIIDEFFNRFDEVSKTSIDKMRQRIFTDLPRFWQFTQIPSEVRKDINLPSARETARKQWLERQKAQMTLPTPEITTTFGDVNIHLPEDSLDRLAEETGKQITEKLKTDETLRKLLARALRPYM